MDIFDEILKYFLLFLVGCFSGFINVIAGGGSMITLPLLMGFGMRSEERRVGKSVKISVELGGRRSSKKNKNNKTCIEW